MNSITNKQRAFLVSVLKSKILDRFCHRGLFPDFTISDNESKLIKDGECWEIDIVAKIKKYLELGEYNSYYQKNRLRSVVAFYKQTKNK